MSDLKHRTLPELLQLEQECSNYISAMRSGKYGRKVRNRIHGQKQRLQWIRKYIDDRCKQSAKETAMNNETPANPKQLYGDKKPDLRLLPLSAQIMQWQAHKDGSNKYGPFNWRKNPVEANTYINAAKRHLELFAAGEGEARDTGVNNLGAVMACCAILIDAELHGTMIDNRIKSKEECDALYAAESMVQKLREAQEERDDRAKPTHAWRSHHAGQVLPRLDGYRKIEVRYRHPWETVHQDKTVFYEVGPAHAPSAVYWPEVHSWRPAHD